MFEGELGITNLPDGFKAFDHFEPDSGIAISLKTMDTSLPSLNRNGQLLARIKSAVDDAKNYDGDYRYPGVFDPSAISQRVVYVVVNVNSLSDSQLSQMARAATYGSDNNVTVLYASAIG